jgi:hypothetical protein
MTFRGFRCPPHTPTAGTDNPIEHCLGACPHPCMAPPLLAAIWRAEQSNPHKGNLISASMLVGSGCARQTWFERQPDSDYHDHPIRKWWSFRGTHAHSIVEQAGDLAAPYGWLQELRMLVELPYPDQPAPVLDAHGNWTGTFDPSRPLIVCLSGTTDIYNPLRPPYPCFDMKSMADKKAEMMVTGNKPGTFSRNLEDKWVWQLNIYRWLLAHTRVPPALKRRYPELKGRQFFPAPEYLGIQGIAMMTAYRTGGRYTVRTGDWPRTRTATYDVDEVPVLPLPEIEAYIRPRALDWYRYLVLNEQPPPVPEDEKWKCKSCPFNGELIAGERCHPAQDRKAA